MRLATFRGIIIVVSYNNIRRIMNIMKERSMIKANTIISHCSFDYVIVSIYYEEKLFESFAFTIYIFIEYVLYT